MKQKLLNSIKMRAILLTTILCAVFTGQAWADDPYYTLDTNSCGNTTNSDYSKSGTKTVDGIGWSFAGNGTQAPWRLGGKSSNANGVDRNVYTTTEMDVAISRIDLTVGTATDITVNSLKLIVSSDADFDEDYKIDEVEVTFDANSTITFEPTSGTNWAKDSYYKFVFNVTVTSGSNKFVQFSKVEFYEYTTGDPSDAPSEAAFTYTEPSINFPATTTYTQAATTAAGYNGTVTYQITANTAGATLEGTTLTVTKGGSVTVKATAPAIDGWAKSEATYTLTVNDTRAANGLAYATATQNVIVGEVLDAPTLTNPNNLSVTYSSDDETVATVDASGNVTGVKIGCTTIKATFEGNNNYQAGTVSYTINVTKAPYVIEDGVFDFVEAGGSNPVVDYGSGLSPSSSTSYITADKTWTAGNVTMVTSKVSGNGYRWWSNDNTLRFYSGSKATFSVPSGYVITAIKTTGANFDGASTGSLSGDTWTGVARSVALSVTGTRNIKTISVTYEAPIPVTLNSYGYATFCSVYPLDFSDDSEFSAWQITAANSSTGVITFSQITGTVDEVTAVLLKGEPSATINVPLADSGTFDVSDNLLVGNTLDADINADEYYGLKGNTFVPVNAGTVPAGKALLPANLVSNVKSFTFVFNGADGIQRVEQVSAEDAEAIFNLAGQRMSKMQRGINIVNGKKVLVK